MILIVIVIVFIFIKIYYLYFFIKLLCYKILGDIFKNLFKLNIILEYNIKCLH
jgi:hypothetical protein